MSEKKPKHRWYQLSLRTLFVGTTVIAVLICVFLASPAERQRRAVRTVERLGGSVAYSTPSDLSESPFLMLILIGRACLPQDYFDPVNAVNWTGAWVKDDDLQVLQGLGHLEYLSLEETQVSDRGLSHLRSHKHLAILFLGRSRVTEAGVAELRKSLTNCDIRR